MRKKIDLYEGEGGLLEEVEGLRGMTKLPEAERQYKILVETKAELKESQRKCMDLSTKKEALTVTPLVWCCSFSINLICARTNCLR